MTNNFTIAAQVSAALTEDVQFVGDRSAALIAQQQQLTAAIYAKQDMILCGVDWANMAFLLCDASLTIEWQFADGQAVKQQQCLCLIKGNARAILTAERTALNFLQSLSATATIVNQYVNLVKHTTVKICDTRKTIPGMRLAQKYAVRVGGGCNQRLGLYDGILIKENHIRACGGIEHALSQAQHLAHINPVSIQIEVENLQQLAVALKAHANNILLDNMSVALVKECVLYNQKRAILEASGGINVANVVEYANTGVDRISIGGLTKNIEAIDLSLQVIEV